MGVRGSGGAARESRSPPAWWSQLREVSAEMAVPFTLGT